ncbi:AmmeMemoRadiSam system protein A [bacterium]|nr:AmmeMemoRadiSam system protein A [bacterium]
MFTEEEKRAMLKMARDSIGRRLGLTATQEAPAITAAMREDKGVFVTLHKQGKLRGCIGNIEGRKALDEGIAELALESAFGDPRFPSLTAEEFPAIDIEISVLTRLTKIENIDEIEIGKHGLYLKKGLNAGLLLPQVATEYRWDRNTFLEETCWKAGLPKDAWKEDAEIYVFGAEIFGEKELSNENAD